MIPALDGFRALAIVGIVLYHVLLFSGASAKIAGTRLGEATVILPLGVDALFIISGFVVFLPTVVRSGDFGSVRAYAIRRAARLAPAYWFMLGLTLVLIATVPPQSPVFLLSGQDLPVPSIGVIVGNLSFAQTPLLLFDSGFPGGLGINSPVWTLSIEVGFYLLLPLIATRYFRHPWLGLLAAAAVSLTWHLVFAHVATSPSSFGFDYSASKGNLLALASDYQFPAWAFSFAAGMTAAWTYTRLRGRYGERSLQRLAALVQPAALLAVAVAAYLSYRYGLAHVGPSEIPDVAGVGRRAPLAAMSFALSLTILMLATAFAPSWQQFPFANSLVRWVADISYGIYLSHFVVMAYLLALIEPSQDGSVETFALWATATLLIAAAYGYLSARFLEKPIRTWARQFGRRADGRPAAAPPVPPRGPALP